MLIAPSVEEGMFGRVKACTSELSERTTDAAGCSADGKCPNRKHVVELLR